MFNKNLKLLFKIVISTACIVFLFGNSDITETLGFIAKTNHLTWISGIILYLLGQVICAYKWKILANEAGFKGTTKDYIDYYFTGMFFNLFLPSTIGGDAIKCFYLLKYNTKQRKAATIYSVLAERITGVTTLIALSSIVIILPVSKMVPVTVKIVIALIFIGLMIFTYLFPVLHNLFANKKWIGKFFEDISIYWRNNTLITRALSWSLIFHLIIILIHILIGHAIGVKVPVLYYFILYPMSSLAGFLPVSFNGIGPREATYIYFLGLIGIKSSAALAFGIFWFGIVLLSSLIGGIFYLKHMGLNNEKENFSAVDEKI